MLLVGTGRRLFDELRRRSGHDHAGLTKLGGQVVNLVTGVLDARTDGYGAFRGDRVVKAHAEFPGECRAPLRKEAIRHRAVQEQADDAPMKRVGVPFEEPPAIEFSLHATIRKGVEIEMESRRVLRSTQDTMWMTALTDVRQLVGMRFWEFRWRARV
jgi:hypothetical protein